MSLESAEEQREGWTQWRRVCAEAPQSGPCCSWRPDNGKMTSRHHRMWSKSLRLQVPIFHKQMERHRSSLILEAAGPRGYGTPSVCSVVSVDPVGLAAATSGYWVSAGRRLCRDTWGMQECGMLFSNATF
ncbi:uncharacterized protein ACB058_003830 isoform 1-T1 [Synchiropus picturatus]